LCRSSAALICTTGFLEIRNPPRVFNACALRFLFISTIFHMVVQITETPSENVAAQDAILLELLPVDLELSAGWLVCHKVRKV
jgi:hypothetical protein